MKDTIQVGLLSFADSQAVIFGLEEKRIGIKLFANFAIPTFGEPMEKMAENIPIQSS